MNIAFYKYQGTGNDFILIDNRDSAIVLNTDQIAHLCNRRFGIGADGLMLLELEAGYDFKMVYFNADGSESTMCGNGGRCITAFAKALGIVQHDANFVAIDGPHKANIDSSGTVSLQMQDVHEINRFDDHCILDTGSPHYIQWVDNASETDVFHHGRTIRNQPDFSPKGINVNFVERLSKNKLFVRTYERGVEDETFSCGTGVTAAAIASKEDVGDHSIEIKTPGGLLNVSFSKQEDDTVNNVILTGPATFVFKGNIEV